MNCSSPENEEIYSSILLICSPCKVKANAYNEQTPHPAKHYIAILDNTATQATWLVTEEVFEGICAELGILFAVTLSDV